MRQAEPLGDPRGDADRPVGAGGDQPVDSQGSRQALDRRLVLGREDAAAVGEAEARRRRIAVDDRHPNAAFAGGLE